MATAHARLRRLVATNQPQHFYLFSPKALDFIHLCLGRTDEARALLAKLAELDPLTW